MLYLNLHYSDHLLRHLLYPHQQLLIGNDVNFCRLRKFCLGLIERAAQPNHKGWSFLITSLSLVEQAHCLRLMNNSKTIVSSSPDSCLLGRRIVQQLARPMDVSIFTFGHLGLSESDSPTYSLIGDLYHLMLVASHEIAVSQSTYEYVASKWKWMFAYLRESEGELRDGTDDCADPLVKALQLNILIVSSCLLLGAEGDQKFYLAGLASRMRSVLTAISGSELSSKFPGALIWCYAIGARFSSQYDQKWFLVQFLRCTQVSMEGALEILLQNVKIVVDCMENIKQLRVGGVL